MWPKRSRACDRSAWMCRRAWKRRPASRIARRFARCSRSSMRRDPDSRGYFGEFGGRFLPETLVEPVEELERAYLAARDDQEFQRELDRWLKHYVGRPTPVYEASRLTQSAGGATIFLKREDLTHTGAHK